MPVNHPKPGLGDIGMSWKDLFIFYICSAVVPRQVLLSKKEDTRKDLKIAKL